MDKIVWRVTITADFVTTHRDMEEFSFLFSTRTVYDIADAIKQAVDFFGENTGSNTGGKGELVASFWVTKVECLGAIMSELR